MKLTARQTLIATAVALLPLAASAQLSYNIGAVSLYKSRGIDQNSTTNYQYKAFRPAIQGGIDYAFENGLYIGNWNSTGKFGDARLEMDVYAGYKTNITEDLALDVGFVRYLYPNSGGGWNGNDVYLGVSYGVFSAKYYQGTSGSVDKNKYLTLGVTLPISETVAFTASVGHLNYHDNTNNLDYTDYSLGVKYDLGDGLSASMLVASSNAKDSAGAKRADGKGRLILGISKSF